MSGGGGESKSTTQNYSPEEAAQRAKVMQEAARVYQGTQNVGAYPGAKPVPASMATLLGQGMLANQALNGQAQVGQLQDAMTYGLNGAMDVNNNPYLSGAIDAAVRPITQSYMDPSGIMSQIRTGTLQAGGTGGTRQGIAEGMAAGRYAQEIGDATSRMASDAYKTGQETFGRTLALAPQTMSAETLPAQWMSSVGAQQENLAQQVEDYNASARMWDLNAPWYPLQNYANMVYGGGSSQSTTTGTNPGSKRSPLMGAAGGAMTGAMMGSVIPGVGTAVGAVAGGILGALGAM